MNCEERGEDILNAQKEKDVVIAFEDNNVMNAMTMGQIWIPLLLAVTLLPCMTLVYWQSGKISR